MSNRDRERRAASAVTAQTSVACVILAHTDPAHLHRLVGALDPFPVFLHIDARVPSETYDRMIDGLPDRVTLLDRLRTGWGRWENVAAELAGYRAALAATSPGHIALLTGTDYPLAGTAEIAATLERYPGKSIAEIHPLPHPNWGQRGGFSRLRYRHWVVGKHMLRLPVPRRFPPGIVAAGGSQLKVLSAEHAHDLLAAVDRNPRLVRYWRRSWIPDETFIPSLLSTPGVVRDWAEGHIDENLWWIGWDSRRRKSPPWLGEPDREALLSRRSYEAQQIPHLFARKFSTANGSELLDLIDERREAPWSRGAPSRGGVA
jgi:hypothetical protein